MEEEKYKIEKINKDIKFAKYNQLNHTIASATCAFGAVFLAAYPSNEAAYVAGGVLGAISLIQLINGGKELKKVVELKKQREELLDSEELTEEVNVRSK